MMPYTPGIYGSPFYGGGPMMMGGTGPFAGIYQVLFGVQNVVFSLTQAIQLIGTNQHALQQSFDTLTAMFDNALATFQELRALEAIQTERETEDQRRRRRRLRALRWTLLMASSWIMYKIIRRLTTTSRRRRIGASSGGIRPTSISTPTGGATPSAVVAAGYNNMSYNPMYGGGLGSIGTMFGGGQYGGTYDTGGAYY